MHSIVLGNHFLHSERPNKSGPQISGTKTILIITIIMIMTLPSLPRNTRPILEKCPDTAWAPQSQDLT